MKERKNIMTCKEKYLKDNPEYSEEDFEVIFKVICPSDQGIMDDPTNEYGDSVCYRVKCINCWNREIPETDENENKSEDESGESIMTCREQLMSEHPEWNNVVLMKCMQTFTPNEYFCIVCPEMAWDDDYPCAYTEPENEEGDISELEALRDEVNTLVERIKQLEVRIANQISTIDNYMKVNQELRSKLNEKESQLESYRKTNEDLGNKLTDARIDISYKDEQIANQKSTIMDYMNIEYKLNTRDEEINKLVKENEELRKSVDILEDGIERREKETTDLHNEIGIHIRCYDELKNNIKKMGFEVDDDGNVIVKLDKPHFATIEEKKYIDTDIAMTRELADKFNSRSNNCAMYPTDIARAIARKMRDKYEALIYVGFSHEDAMGLIPMWSD